MTETDTQNQRDGDTHTHTHTHSQNDRDRHTESERRRHTHTHTHSQNDRDRHTESERRREGNLSGRVSGLQQQTEAVGRAAIVQHPLLKSSPVVLVQTSIQHHVHLACNHSNKMSVTVSPDHHPDVDPASRPPGVQTIATRCLLLCYQNSDSPAP